MMAFTRENQATHGGLRRRKLALCGALSAMFLTVPAWAQTTSFTATYQGTNNTTCNTSFSINGEEPSASGTFPVFLYMVGTTETFNNASATAAVQGMANRGYVAGTIQYDSGAFGSCSQISSKAACIFNPNSASSAV